jgi:protein-tyrosine phosphatase
MSRTRLPSGWRAARFRLANLFYGPGTKTRPWTWIGDTRVAIGSLPTPTTLAVLKDREGVTHVVNCRADKQVRLSGDRDMEQAIFGADHVAHAPMWDHGRPQREEAWTGAAEFGARALEDPDAKVLIHCQRGRRRSAMVAYAVLRLRGLSAAQAARAILLHRREAELVPAYRTNVEDWLSSRTEGAVEQNDASDGPTTPPALT